MRRMRFFASRNAREILRDPISVGFGVAFPILLLLLLSFLNRHIPAEAHMTLFEPEQLAPGVSVFSLSFLALFSALLLSRDRSSALILRLYASPLTGRDFILGYLLPMLPMALAQTLVCLLAAIPLGLPVSWRILACTAVNVPIALVNLALGMLCGTLRRKRPLGGMCGALLIQCLGVALRHLVLARPRRKSLSPHRLRAPVRQRRRRGAGRSGRGPGRHVPTALDRSGMGLWPADGGHCDLPQKNGPAR